MKEQSFSSLLPWFLLAIIVVGAIAPYLGSRQFEPGEEVAADLESSSDTSTQVKGELADLDELVGK